MISPKERTICRFIAAIAAVIGLFGTAVAAVPGRIDAASLRPYLEGRVSHAERRLLDDAADGRWDRHSLLEAALIADGVSDPQRIARCEGRLAGFVAELKRSGGLGGPADRRARTVYEFMHERILTGGYDLDATGLETALESGRFNCVSSTVLFVCLGRRCGLAVSGLEMPGHAKARLFTDGDSLDIETTYPEWFGAGRSGGNVRRSGADSPNPQPATLNSQPAPRPLSPVELVAMIYYNRGVDLLAEERFAEASAANAMALRLDPASETARGNLLAVLNNWAIDLGRRGSYREAAELLAGGLALAPEFGTFKTNYVYVYHRWVEDLCREGRYEAALARLAAAGRAVPGEPYFRQARAEVYSRWAKSTPPGGTEFDAAPIAH